MKYIKGTFTIVPNTEYLKGKAPVKQLLFFWICYHSDENGICYPSRSKLASEIGCDVRTVDKYIKELVNDGAIEKTTRKKQNSKENSSNVYQVLQIESLGSESDNTTLANVDTLGSERNVPVTILNNYTQLTNNNTTEEEAKESATDSVISNTITLPINRGKHAPDRVLSIYRDLFKYTYGFDYKVNFGRDKNIIKGLLVSFTEIQLARLLIVYFNWAGMTGTDVKEKNFLSGATYPLPMFSSNTPKYEAFVRNVLKEDFDNERELYSIIGKEMTALRK